MDKDVPFLQIIHISDIHVVDPATTNPNLAMAIRMRIRKARRISPPLLSGRLTQLENLMRDGLAASYPVARVQFQRFLRDFTQAQAEVPTWVLQTGDLTTFGDHPSIQRAQDFLKNLDAGPLGKHGPLLRGNHDAWPGTLPLFAPFSAAKHESRTSSLFATAPGKHLTQPLPDGSGEVQLWSVDSVNAKILQNTFARGALSKADRKALTDGLEDAADRQLRILACHHPIRYPHKHAGYSMVLADQDDVCGFLRAGAGRAVPLFHMILSGHTHDLSPPVGQLPESVVELDQPPLANSQCQLVVGSMSQVDPDGKRERLAQHFQVLRFFYDPENPNLVWLQRLVAARTRGDHSPASAGGFKILNEDGEAQEMCFEI